ncbi:competence protein ComEC [Pseudoalteromonas sp. MBR-15]|jgi:competence protein ComEC
MSFAVILASLYFKPFLSVLSGFICGIFIVIFHYLIFYSASLCQIEIDKPIDAHLQIISIHSVASPYYAKVRLINVQGCSLPRFIAPLAMLSITTEKQLDVGSLLTSQVKLKAFRTVKNFDSFNRERFAFTERIIYKGRTVGKTHHLSSTSSATIRSHYQSYISDITAGTKLQWMYYALLTGDRSKISSVDKTHLRELGLSHLLAISGLHIGLIFTLGFYTSKWVFMCTQVAIKQSMQLSKLFVVFGFCCAFLYVYLSDFVVSATRALVMLGCYLIIYLLAKNPLQWRSILFALSVVLVMNPFSLLNPGFYFSFTAVAIIFLVINQPLTIKNGLIKHSVQLFMIQGALFVGLLPLSLYFFDGVSVIGLLVNLIAVPLISLVVMPLLVMYSLLSMIVDTSYVFKLFDAVFYSSFEFIISTPDDWRWVDVRINGFKSLLYLYCTLLIGLFSPFKRFSIIPSFIFIIDWLLTPKPLFQLDLFDVGHGLMAMVSTNNKAIVYDLGPQYFARYDYVNSVLVANIRQQNLEVVATIISHQDNDHAGGLTSWKQAGYTATFEKFHPSGIKLPCLSQHFKFENLNITSLTADSNHDNNNDRSCILKISNPQHSVLLTGDISKFIEQQLVSQEVDLNATILISPHHGSNTSSSGLFIDAVNPEIVLHSSAYQGQWSFPHSDVVKRYNDRDIPQYTTAEYGHIRIKFYPQSYRLEFAREQESYWFE